MTGQVKEQIITRFGELGVEVCEGCVRFAPRLIPGSEFTSVPRSVSFRGGDGRTTTLELEAGSLAFTYCSVPVVYRLGNTSAIELQLADGRLERLDGPSLTRAQSSALFARGGAYRRISVTVPADAPYGSSPPTTS